MQYVTKRSDPPYHRDRKTKVAHWKY